MLKKVLSLLIFSFILFDVVVAQSVSYNINSVPISGLDNTAVGFQSLTAITFGNGNAALGFQTLSANNRGSFNTALGSQSLSANISGNNNTAVGYQTLLSNQRGSGNTAVGSKALSNISSIGLNFGNTAVGSGAIGLGSGWNNTAIGASANPYGGFGNSSVGFATLLNCKGCSANTAFGTNSLSTDISGYANTAIGTAADVAIDALTNATAIGFKAIVNASNTMQFGNSDVTQVYAGTGTNATLIAGGLQITGGVLGAGKVLTSNSTGVATWQTPLGGGGSNTSWNLAGNAGTLDWINFIGTTDNSTFNIRVNNEKSGKIDNIYKNVFFGYQSGNNTNTGSSNNAATENVAIGHQALFSNRNAYGNTAIGFNAMYSLVGSTTINNAGNVALGWRSLYLSTAGNDNTALGSLSLYNNLGSDGNTAVGSNSLSGNTFGIRNTGVGLGSLNQNTIGNYNVGLGYTSDLSINNLQNATAIGYGAIANASDKIVIGLNSSAIVIGGYASWSNLSDGRFKENVKDDVPGLIFINKLRPVTYTININKLDEHIMKYLPDSVKANKLKIQNSFSKVNVKIQTGFIAQEVEKTVEEIGYSFDGINAPKNETDNYSLAYAQFTVPLVKAVQELSKQNDDLKKDIADLRLLINALKNNTVEGSIKITEANKEARLFQNAPNPFSKTTTIRYSLPTNTKRAAITITTLEGIKIKTVELNNKIGEALNINGGELSAGIYIYTLVVDDKIVDSLKMVLTK